MFSELIAAIEYTGLKDYYTQTDNKYTFLALNNAGMQLYREMNLQVQHPLPIVIKKR